MENINIIIIRDGKAIFKEAVDRGMWHVITCPHESNKVKVCFNAKKVYRNYNKKGRILLLPTLFFTKREVKKVLENLRISYTMPRRKRNLWGHLEDPVTWLKDCSFSHDNLVVGKEHFGYIKHTFMVDIYDTSDCFNPIIVKTIKCANEKEAQKWSTLLAWRYEDNRIVHEKEFKELAWFNRRDIKC
jgi:hypothetical protein